LWGLWVHGIDSVWPLLVLLFVNGAITGLMIPSWQAFVSELVPREVMLNAVTLNSAQFNAARFIGPLVAAPVLATAGAGACFFINGVSFVTVIGALILMRLPGTARDAADRPKRRIIGDFFDAARETRAYPGIRASFYAVFALGAMGGPLAQLLAVFADRVFHVDARPYAYLGIAMGAGSIIAAPFIAGPGSAIRRSQLLLIAMFGYGTALIVFAATDWYALGFAALLVTSAGWLGIASALNTTIQLQVPEHIRGKVLALYVMVLTFAMPIGVLVQGAAAEHFGAQVTVFVAGALFLLVTLWLWKLSGLLPHVDDDGAWGGDGGSVVVEGVDASIEVEEGLPLGAPIERHAPPAG
jgi:MFS family permease